MNERHIMAVEPGWERVVLVRGGFHAVYRVLVYTDGTYRFEHKCKGWTEDDGTVVVKVCAPALQLDNGGHRIESTDPLTVAPSILCPDCGLHGFIHDGRWIEA
jgi:hypothetical protein